MKLTNTFAVGALALALASVASATTIKITGSSAYRKAIFSSAIANGFTEAAYVGASIDKANQAVFRKSVGGGSFDYISCCFAGSVGGIKWLSTNEKVGTSPTASKAISWLDPLDNTFSAATDGGSPDFVPAGGAQVAADQASVALTRWEDNGVGAGTVADFTMSDSNQASTAYNSLSLNEVISGGVGVVPFVFAKGKAHGSLPSGSYNRFLNVSALAYQYIAANGVAPLALFTGNSADASVDVVLTGRDNDSGTRLATNFESGFGNVDTYMFQNQPFTSGNVDGGSATGLTINHFTAFNLGTGQAGYASGGSVKNALSNAVTGAGPNGNSSYIILGYVGEGDSPTQQSPATAAGGGQELAYNGVNYSVTATQLGQYSFWTIETMYVRPDMTNAAKNAIGLALAQTVHDTHATAAKSGILLDANFLPTRASEGAVISPNY